MMRPGNLLSITSLRLLILLVEMMPGYLVCGQTSDQALKISPVTSGFYVYTTFQNVNGVRFPSNSMYIVTEEGIVLIDTPWDTTQLQPLLDTIESRHHRKTVLCVVTHYHNDRTRGLDFLKANGVKTYSSKLTYDLCKELNERQAAYYFEKDTVFTIGGHSFETYYAGPGHTKDNIVIWFGKEKILYGGCLIKSTESPTLGNIADADLNHWPITVTNLKKKFPAIVFVITGHQDWKSTHSLDHTLQLLRLHKK